MNAQRTFLWTCVLGVAACRQIAGIDDRGVATGEDRCATAGPGACGTCTRQACCDEIATCHADAACASLWACLSACAAGDEACRAACRASQPLGLGDKLDALLACQDASCAADCALACGNYLYPSADCASCTQQSCCAEANACAADAECTDLGACIRACSSIDYPCIGACVGRYGAAYAAATALSTCVDKSCRDVCGYDEEWGCVGKRATLTSSAATMPFVVTVWKAGTQQGNPGLDVRACDQADIECQSPLGSGTTDASGNAAFTLPNGFQGYFEVSSSATPPAITHSIVYIGPPQYTSGSIVFIGADAQTLAAIKQVAQTNVPGTSLLFLQANGCAGSNRGASFALDAKGPGVTGYYLRNGVPVAASATVYETDESGAGGFVNVPVGGGVIATWSVHATGQVIQTRAIALRADSVTYDLNW